MLNDEEWKGWSDREIARQCDVNHELVGRLREQLKPVLTGVSASGGRSYTTKHDTTATMKTSEPPRRQENGTTMYW